MAMAAKEVEVPSTIITILDEEMKKEVETPPLQPASSHGKPSSRAFSTATSARLSYTESLVNPVEVFAWRDITFYYPPKRNSLKEAMDTMTGAGGSKADREARRIMEANTPALDKVSGYADAGSMVAVIGASGAGKSTLLDILARRFNKGRLEGDMMVNGAPVSDDDFKEIAGYVPQEDVFVATQTAKEALMFIANLKMGPKVPKARKEALIHSLAGDAGLASQLNTKIGGVIQGGMRIKGMSGGEKRRLSLVACAITNPSIMFLDEPTSGLDSYAALKIIRKASDWANRGRIVLCTIHQPRAQIWELFDEVLILGAQGRQVYYGPVDNVPSWFDSLGYAVPAATSVSDFVLDLLNNSFIEKEDILESKSLRKATSRGLSHRPTAALVRDHSIHVNVPEVSAIFKASRGYNDMMTHIKESESGHGIHLNRATKVQVSWWTCLMILLRRNGLNYLRNPGNVAARLVMIASVAVLDGIAFGHVTAGIDKVNIINLPMYIQTIFTTLTLCVIVLTLLPFVSISLFIYDRQYFHKEYRAALYPASAYFVANVLLELLVNATTGFIFGVTCYFMHDLGQENGGGFHWQHFFTYIMITILIANVGCMQSIMMSLIAPNQDVAFVMNCGYITVALFTAGQMVPYHILKKEPLLYGLQWFSSMRYGWRALVANEFEGVVFPNTQQAIEGGPKVVTATWAMCDPHFGMTLCDLHLWEDVAALCLVFAVMASVSFWALKHLNKD